MPELLELHTRPCVDHESAFRVIHSEPSKKSVWLHFKTLFPIALLRAGFAYLRLHLHAQDAWGLTPDEVDTHPLCRREMIRIERIVMGQE